MSTRAIASGPPPAARDQRGYSLIETLVALLLLAAALVFILGALSSFTATTARNESRSNAAAAARTRLEQLRFADPASLPSTGSDATLATVGQSFFTVITQYCVNAAYCDASTRHLIVQVQEEGQDVFQTETVVTQLH